MHERTAGASAPAAREVPCDSLDPASIDRARTSWRLRRAAAEYAVVALLATVLGAIVVRLWRAHLHVPFVYLGDALPYEMLVQSLVDHGGALTFPQLGAPGRFDLYDYPFANEWGHVVAIRLLGLFTSSWPLVFNAYFLLGFPLIAASAFAVLRHHRVPIAPAAAVSLLYCLLPSRLLKGETHFFLDVFYQVPLAVLVVLWVCSDAPPLVHSAWPLRLDVRGRRSIAALAICALVSVTGLYYGFFTAVLLLAAGLWASIERRTLRHAASGAALAGVVVAGVVLCLAPSWIYRTRHGANLEVGVRSPLDADRFGLKIADLLHPVNQHAIGALARLTARYDAVSHPGVACTEALGVIGAAGFLLLLVRVFVRVRGDGSRARLARSLAAINLAAVLFASVGGFGSIFAWAISPQIRSYSRMSVFLGFLALFAVALVLERLGRGRPRLAVIASLGVLVVGALDQGTAGAIPEYDATRADFVSDEGLVRRMEAALPDQAMVFELPYLTYPESPELFGVSDYEPLRPSLHTRALRWSYPAMRGRFDDAWIHATAELEPERMVAVLADAGFEGILVARRGYADRGARIEGALRRLLGTPGDESDNGRLVFFSMRAYLRAAAGEAPDVRAALRDRALHPILLRWSSGFYALERELDRPVRWAGKDGEVWIQNGSATPRSARLTMEAIAAVPPAQLAVEGDGVSEHAELGGAWSTFTWTLVVAPGEHAIHFHVDGARADAPIDPRVLVWRLRSVTLDEVATPPR